MAQEVIYWGDNITNLLLAMAAWDSMVSVAANAQQLPHFPWALTGVTTP